MAVAISEPAPLIRNNVIEDFIMNGIGCSDGLVAVIDHNIIQTVSGGDAIYISESNPVVKNNLYTAPAACSAYLFITLIIPGYTIISLSIKMVVAVE